MESDPHANPYVSTAIEVGGTNNPGFSTKRTPPSWMLVCLNAGLILIASLFGSRWPFGIILALVSSVFLILLSGVWQLIVRLIERRFFLNTPVRVVAYLLPFLALVGLPLLGIRPSQPANKRYPAESTTGIYTARVNAPGEYWCVNIVGKDGSKFDEKTDFVGHFNVYWCWDASDRLWIYNSDDGMLHYWQRDGSTWKHCNPGSATDVKSSGPLKPPDALLPDYARK